ncbi:MAG: OmpA family protein [Deltaproteobacteria bacterium]|nr:OmpA family protein [Deltaproteobacteria bacterium]
MHVFVLLLAVMGGCGSSAKPKRFQAAFNRSPGPASDATPTERSPGDVTVATSTGDDLWWLEPIYFAFDSSELTPHARDTLVKLHQWMVQHPKATVSIEGHCDEQGTTEYNIGLGQRRAQSLTDYLVRLGTDDKRVQPTSFGSERPAVEGHDEVAWQRNRRGEFRVRP